MAQLADTSLFNDANLVAYWKLEDVNDSKNGYNLTNNGTTPFNAAKFVNGADFGTSNTTKWLGISNALGIDGGNISVSLWWKPGDLTSGTQQWLFSQANTTSKTAYEIRMSGTDPNSGTLTIERRKPGVANETGNYRLPFVVGDWHHICLTYDGTTMKGYINGVERISFAASGNGSATETTQAVIGSANVGSANQLAQGIIDDVGVFSRALTATEVSTLYTDAAAASNKFALLGVG